MNLVLIGLDYITEMHMKIFIDYWPKKKLIIEKPKLRLKKY